MAQALNPAIQSVEGIDSGRGWRWWADAASWLFGDSTKLGLWIGMTLCWLVIHFVLGWIPVVGHLVSLVLWFVFSGSFAICADKTVRRAPMEFGDLFSGFGPPVGGLIVVAVIVLLLCAAIFGLMMVFGLAALLSAVTTAFSFETFMLLTPPQVGVGIGAGLAMFACLLLFIPLSMAAWLAPALVALRGANPVDALRASLAACRRNIGALVLYGLIGIGLAVVATLSLLLGWLLLTPLVFLSTYAAYRDLFAAGAADVIDV